MCGAIVPSLSQNLSRFLKGHPCSTAILKMTDWCASLDVKESIALAQDLSKAFDSVNHNLLMAKLKAYTVFQLLQLIRLNAS